MEGTLWSLETRRRCFQSQFRFHHVVFKTWAADWAPHPHGVLLVLEGCGQRGLEWGGGCELGASRHLSLGWGLCRGPSPPPLRHELESSGHT